MRDYAKTENDLGFLVAQCLLENGYNPQYVKLELHAHPEFPSLEAIADTLNRLRIPNIFTRLGAEHLPKIKNTFLAYFSSAKDSRLVKVSRNSKTRKFKVYYSEKETEIIDEREFLKCWNGIVVLLEPSAVKESLWPPKYLSSFFFLFLFSLPLILLPPHWSAHYLLSTLGLWAGIFKLQTEFNNQPGFIRKFCNLGRNFACRENHYIKGPDWLKKISLTDLAIVYFAVQILFYMVGGQWVSVRDQSTVMTYWSLLSIPFILYSFSEQIDTKRWCPICLFIDLVLILQLLFLPRSAAAYGLISILPILLLGAFAFAGYGGVNHLRNIFGKSLDLKISKQELLSFRRNWNLLAPYFKESAQPLLTDVDWQKTRFPTKHYDHGIWDITLVLHPSCPSCGQVMSMIDAMQEKLKCFASLTMIFNIKNCRFVDEDAQVAGRVIMQFLDGSTDWYENYKNRPHKKWKNRLPSENMEKSLEVHRPKAQAILEDMRSWCHSKEFDWTPIILVNGKIFPRLYDLSDFEFLMSKIFLQKET